ncbi:MAG: hypothetical protein ACRDZZ_07545, partial [Ilumatobacteraceae bacterium]
MRRLPSIRCIGAVVAAMSLVGACDDDETLSLDQAADVDDGAVVIGDEGGAGGPFGTADVSFDGVTASVGGVSCSNEARLVVTPIVSDSFTL